MQLQTQSQSQSQPFIPQVTDAFRDGDKRIVKVSFPLSAELNKLGWGVREDYRLKHLHKFVDKPGVVTPDHWHARYEDVEFGRPVNDLLPDLIKSQSKYGISLVRKAEQNNTRPDIYDFYLEFTDPKAIEAFDNGDIPKYVSPTILKVHREEPNDAITDYEPLHIAFVDEPAFGVLNAGVRGTCDGSLVTCYNQLQNAGVHCVKSELASFKNKFGNSSLIESQIQNASLNLSTNLTPPNAGVESPAISDNQPTANVQPTQQPTTKDAVGNITSNPIPQNEIERIKQEFEAKYGKELQELREKDKIRTEREQKNEIATRRDLISGYITPKEIPNEEERNKEIQFYIELTDDTDKLVQALKKRYIQKPVEEVTAKSIQHGGILPNANRRLSEYADNQGIGVLNGGISNVSNRDPALIFSLVQRRAV